MTLIIDQKAKQKIEDYKNSLSSEENFNVSPVIKKQYHYELTVSQNNVKVKLLVYFGKKGIKTVLQGNTESSLYKKVNGLINDQTELYFAEEKFSEPESYIGTDESGKGDFFGPLVIAAFFVDKSSHFILSKMGVRDSKDLTEFQILKLAKSIKESFPNNYKIISISPKKYNDLYPKFNNLNKFLVWAHSKAIEEMLKIKKCDVVITDKFSKRNLTVDMKLNGNLKVFQFTKGERYKGVAAASILARERMVNWFKTQEKNGIILPKGSSDAVIDKASEIIKHFGKQKLYDLAKLHFKISKKL